MLFPSVRVLFNFIFSVVPGACGFCAGCQLGCLHTSVDVEGFSREVGSVFREGQLRHRPAAYEAARLKRNQQTCFGGQGFGCFFFSVCPKGSSSEGHRDFRRVFVSEYHVLRLFIETVA